MAVQNFARCWDGYFLYDRFRIATIKLATAMIIMSSSYVLISITLPVRLRSDDKHVPRLPG